MIFSIEDADPLIIRKPLPDRNWNQIYHKGLSLKPYWYEAERFDKIYTLGKTQYLVKPYELTLPPYEEVSFINKLLLDNFSDLYGDVKKALNEVVSSECVWEDRLWHPGFHFFPCTKTHRVQVSKPHCDYNYLSVDWASLGKPDQIKAMLSFTLPIYIPNIEDFGIQIWNCTDAQLAKETEGKNLSDESFLKTLNQFDHQIINYNIGELIIHPGRFFHEIIPFKGSSDEYRFSMQGHAVFKKDRWSVFW